MKSKAWLLRVLLLAEFGSFFVLLASGCAGSGPRVKDVIELAPPRHVRLVQESGGWVVTWEASPHETRPDFAGYNVYLGRRSLVFGPVRELPEPFILPKTEHAFRLPPLEAGVSYFVHVRSRSTGGALSLPSLPELHLGG